MRFISPFPRYRIVAKHQDYEILASGMPRIKAEGYTAEFTNSDVTDWELDVARERFTFRGTTKDLADRPIDPVRTRVSSFDTSKIRNEALRKEVEEALLNNSAHGHDYIVVEKPKVPEPWIGYDKAPAQKIAPRVKEDGYTSKQIEAVIAYERENKNRPSVIEALEALREVEPEEELVAA